MTLNELAQAVKLLPEVYQPIYNHSELSLTVSRTCDNRLVYIKKVYEALCKKKGSPLRVLDLGCAQGYISLSIASWGANVTGVDFLDKNIDVCNILSKENQKFSTRFVCGKIETVIQQIKKDEYDLVLGLSVFHHLCYAYGSSKICELIKSLSDKVSVGIFELALKQEPLYWAKSLPEDYRELLQGFSCIKLLAKMPTHLSDIVRPLCYASNKYVFSPEQTLIKIEKTLSAPHNLTGDTHLGTRRYYIGEGFFIKCFCVKSVKHSIRDEYNRSEIDNEIAFLDEMGGKENFPVLLQKEINDEEVWVMRKNYEGQLLSEMITNNITYDAWKIIQQALEYLVVLEKKGFYCNDLRTWNFIYMADGKIVMIDYGSISTQSKDCQWPYNNIVSFFIFMHEVLDKVIRIEPFRNINVVRMLHKWLSQKQIADVLSLEDNENIFSKLYAIIFDNANQVSSMQSRKLTTKNNIEDAQEEMLDLMVDKIQQINTFIEYSNNSLVELHRRQDEHNKKLDEISNNNDIIAKKIEENNEDRNNISMKIEKVIKINDELNMKLDRVVKNNDALNKKSGKIRKQ